MNRWWQSIPANLRRILKPLFLVGFGIILVFLMVEIVLRVYFTYFGSDMDKVMYLYSAAEIHERNPAFIPLAFVGFGPSPKYPENNRLGYRGDEIEIPKPDGVFRIVAAGGSTTYGSGLGPEDTWPAQLQTILRDEYGYANVEVVNSGTIAYTSWNTLTNFSFRVLELEPDFLIVYHGINDMLARNKNPDCYQGENPLRGLNEGMWRVEGPDLSWSVFYRYVAIRFDWMPNPMDVKNWIWPVETSMECGDGKTYTFEENLEANPPVYFERNMRSLVAVAQAHGVDVMLSTWAYYPPPKEDYWRENIQKHNAITLRLADEMNVPAYDLLANMPVDEGYWLFDNEHQSAKGTYEQAHEYATFMIEEGLLPPPPDSNE